MKQQLIALFLTLGGAAAAAHMVVNIIVPWAQAKFMGYGSGLLIRALRADSVQDENLKSFQQDVVLAFIKLAEAEIPGTGMGSDRKAWVEKYILQLFPWLKGHEGELADAIDKCVIDWKTQLKSLEQTKGQG